MRTEYLKTCIITILICLQIVLALTTWTMLNNIQSHKNIPRGIKINGVPVGGLSEEQAQKLLMETFGNGLTVPPVIRAGKESINFIPDAVDAKLDYERAIKEALNFNKKPRGLNELLMELALLAKSHNIPLTLQFSHDKMARQLAELKNLVDVAPQSATLIGDESERILVPEKPGHFLDVSATLDQISALSPPLADTIQAVMVRENAPVTAKDLEPLRNILGECETEFNPAQKNRTANITLAINALHNTLVKPGEIFSFNELVGERSTENGFKNAPVIVGNRTSQDLGGGVCQVSTTLYNALLAANLEIVERKPHTIPVGYVSPGLDATVADGQIDLRFRNNRQFPVFITGFFKDSKIQIRLWGILGDNEPRINIETNIQTVNPKTLFHQDPSLPQGSRVVRNPGRRGYIARVYKLVKGSHDETRQLITRDYYPPEDKIILVGTGGSASNK